MMGWRKREISLIIFALLAGLLCAYFSDRAHGEGGKGAIVRDLGTMTVADWETWDEARKVAFVEGFLLGLYGYNVLVSQGGWEAVPEVFRLANASLARTTRTIVGGTDVLARTKRNDPRPLWVIILSVGRGEN